MTGTRACQSCSMDHPVLTTCHGGWCDEAGDPDEVTTRRERNKALEGHICGWARVNGQWVCIQDYRVSRIAPRTSCHAVWTPAREAA